MSIVVVVARMTIHGYFSEQGNSKTLVIIFYLRGMLGVPMYFWLSEGKDSLKPVFETIVGASVFQQYIGLLEGKWGE